MNDEDSCVVRIPLPVPIREFDTTNIPKIPSHKHLHVQDEEAASLSLVYELK